jgi:integral membrane protein
MTGTTAPAVPLTDGALLRYRVMAYVVGTLLVLLVCVAVPLQVWGDSDLLVKVVGIAHGYLFMVMLATVGDLWRRRRFPLSWVLLVAVSGLVPFLTFVAERQVTARVRDGRF